MSDRPIAMTSVAVVLAVLLGLVLVRIVSVGFVGTTVAVQDGTESTVTTDDVTEISTCQEITSPGDDELVNDISPGNEDDLTLDPEKHSGNACLVLNASSVTLDGQGYTINGSAFYDEDTNPEHSVVRVQNLSEAAWMNEESELYEPTVTDIAVEEWRDGINFSVADSPTVTEKRTDLTISSGIGGTRKESDKAIVHVRNDPVEVMQ